MTGKTMSSSTSTSSITTTVVINPDLARERNRASFDGERLTVLLDGGSPARTARRRQLEQLIARDPSGVFRTDQNAYLHRTERYVRSLAKHVRLVELCRQLGVGDDKECHGDITASPDFPLLLAAVADDLPTALHWVMFVPNLRSLCDDAQLRRWLPLCRDWRVIGCYAQTELGHGSNVRALETTATFLPERRGGEKGGSFIVNSPTLTSTKFWPGTLGRTANHAMVIARLIDGDGVDRGVHNFLVPLRGLRDHKLLPGVETGDIGPKIGYNTMDNGYCRFDNVRIPRRNMAMRFAVVDERGRYRVPHETAASQSGGAASKIAYITMMQVRAHICNEAGKNLAMACTIVVRYSAVRRQGFVDGEGKDGQKNEGERQILDYTQQQHRIFPLLAASYGFFFTGQKILRQLKDIEDKLVAASKDDDNSNTAVAAAAVTKAVVADIHASSSGLKSYMTTVAADGIEECRKACGGHGFLQCSGLPELFTTYLQSPTVEGDNHMLPQQVMKVLLKLVDAVRRNDAQKLRDYEPCDSYLLLPSLRAILLDNNGNGGSERCSAQSAEDLLDLPACLLPAFRHRAARGLVQVAEHLRESVTVQGGLSPSEAWNQALVTMARANRGYAQFLLLRNFVDGIGRSGQANSSLGAAEVRVLQNLARLLGLYWMEQDLGDFLVDGYLSAEQSRWVRSNVLHLLGVIRPDAVALVDARDFSDFRLKSALGRYDGNVYPAILEAARRDPLNQSEPGPGYEEHLKRLIVGGVGKYSGTASRL